MVAAAYSHTRYAQLGQMSAHFLDVMQGLFTLKLFNRSKAQIQTITHITDQYQPQSSNPKFERRHGSPKKHSASSRRRGEDKRGGHERALERAESLEEPGPRRTLRAAMDAVLRPVPEAEAYLRRAEAALQPDPE